MADRITRAFVQTAMTNTTTALLNVGILRGAEHLEMRDSGGIKFPIRLDVMDGTTHATTIVSDCNLRTALTAIEALRVIAYHHKYYVAAAPAETTETRVQ